MERHLQAPISKEELKTLKSGDYVYITGTIYTARDAAHKRMYETLQNQENLPIDIQDQIIYYMGPSPAREGRPIGSLEVRQRPAAWINIHHSFWILGWVR